MKSTSSAIDADFMPTLPLGGRRRARGARERLLAMPWWCFPPGLALGFLLPVLLLIAGLRGADHPGLIVRGLMFLNGSYVALGCAVLIMLAAGGWLGGQLHFGTRDGRRVSQAAWDAPAVFLGLVALAAYCLWFRDYVFNPVLMWQTLTGAHRPSRDTITLMPGLTSFVNVSPAFFAILAYRWFLSSSREPLPMYLKALAVTLVGFVFFRAYAWSERLATIEAAAPWALAAVVRLSQKAQRPSRPRGRLRSMQGGPRQAGWGWRRILLVGGPYLAIPGVIGLFGLFEFFRSWESGPYARQMGFLDFVVGRFATYYFTALNNGAGLLETTPWPTYDMKFVLSWFYNLPGINLGRIVMADGSIFRDPTDRFLVTYGDVEFNSPSAIYSAIVDLGIPLGALYFFLTGVMAGFACRAYRQGRLVGVLLYPTAVVAFSEMFRYIYLAEPRAITNLFSIGLVLVWTWAAAGRARTMRSAAR